MRKKPKAARIIKIGEAWRPYRTVACWYLWRSLENQQEKAEDGRQKTEKRKDKK